MNDIANVTDEAERWQRIACKLAWILSQSLPEEAEEFLRFAADIKELCDSLNDYGWDMAVNTERMTALAPAEVMAVTSLPASVRHADVRH